MTNSPREPAIEMLLAHRAWLESVALAIAKVEPRAEDAAQDTWVAALTSSAATNVRSPRAWLRRVLHHRIVDLRRHDSRRRRREAVPRPARDVPRPDEILARVELDRTVACAVLELREPYRSTVLLRFHGELTNRGIADQMGVPLETVRTRLRRALKYLRVSLERDLGSDRDAGLGALSASLTGPAYESLPSGSAAPLLGASVMASKSAVALGVAILVVGGVSTLMVARSDPDEVERLAVALVEARGALARSEARVRELQSVLRERDRSSRAVLAPSRDPGTRPPEVGVDQTGDSEREGTVASSRSSPRFPFAESDEVLADVDLDRLGASIAALVPLLRQSVDRLSLGEDLEAETLGALQTHNGPLVTAIRKIAGNVPSAIPGAAYLHPAVSSNIMVAALETAGRPLAAEQAVAMERLAREHTDLDRRRRENVDESDFALREIVDEATARQRFFDAAFDVLDDEQRDALRPASLRGKGKADLFSESELWMGVVSPFRHSGPSDITDLLVSGFARRLKLAEDEHDRIRQVIEHWVSRLPQGLLYHEPSKLDDARMFELSHVRACADEMLGLLVALDRAGDLTAGQVSIVRQIRGVVIPLFVADD